MSEIHGWTHAPNGVDAMEGTYVIKVFPDPGSPAALEVPELAIVTVGDGAFVFPIIDRDIAGSYLREVEAGVSEPGAVEVQLHHLSTTGTSLDDMLSTPLTIDGGEFTSISAAAAPVIDLDNSQVLLGEAIRIDIDAADGDAQGLSVKLGFGPRLAV